MDGESIMEIIQRVFWGKVKSSELLKLSEECWREIDKQYNYNIKKNG